MLENGFSRFLDISQLLLLECLRQIIGYSFTPVGTVCRPGEEVRSPLHQGASFGDGVGEEVRSLFVGVRHRAFCKRNLSAAFHRRKSRNFGEHVCGVNSRARTRARLSFDTPCVPDRAALTHGYRAPVLQKPVIQPSIVVGLCPRVVFSFRVHRELNIPTAGEERRDHFFGLTLAAPEYRALREMPIKEDSSGCMLLPGLHHRRAVLWQLSRCGCAAAKCDVGPNTTLLQLRASY